MEQIPDGSMSQLTIYNSTGDTELTIDVGSLVAKIRKSNIIPPTQVLRPVVFEFFFHTPQRESPNSIQQNRLHFLQRHISSGERN